MERKDVVGEKWFVGMEKYDENMSYVYLAEGISDEDEHGNWTQYLIGIFDSIDAALEAKERTEYENEHDPNVCIHEFPLNMLFHIGKPTFMIQADIEGPLKGKFKEVMKPCGLFAMADNTLHMASYNEKDLRDHDMRIPVKHKKET